MRWLRAGSLVALLVMLALALSPTGAWAEGPAAGRVTAAALNVRSGPGTSFPVVGGLQRGDRVVILGSQNGWHRISFGSGDAWVSGAYVQPEDAAAQTNPNGNLIVFQQASGGGIYVVNPDGSGLRRLTNGIDPALSPDGRWVAFTRWDGSADGVSGSVWIVGVDGTGERRVLDGVRQPKSPAWSPNGTRILVNTQQGGPMDPVRRCVPLGPGIPDIPPGAYDIVIEPDKFRVCFTAPPDPYWGLRVVDLETGNFEDLPRDLQSFSPAWNPLHDWEVVYRGDHGLMRLDLSANSTLPLLRDTYARGPAFSPDGRRLAVSYWQKDHWEVHVLNADGSGQRRLTETPITTIAEQIIRGEKRHSWNNAAPTWSPDGAQLAFLTDRTGRWEIWIMNADGSGQRPLFPAGVPGGVELEYYGVDERVLSWK